MLVPILGALAMLAGALTVWLARTRPVAEQDPDAGFWYIFTGACVLAPLVLGAALLNRGSGAAIMAAVAGTLAAANKFTTFTLGRRLAKEQASRSSAEFSALAARHQSVLRAWSHFELDPAAAIAHPQMHDVNSPATAALARALAAAETARMMETGYRQAVIGLETAFRRAEQGQAPFIEDAKPRELDA